MSLIKRKILLEDSTDRSYGSTNWGVMTATTFFINVFLTQTSDDMGLFTDIDYISASTTNNLSGLTESELVTLRLLGKKEEDYYNYLNLVITGSTDSKIDDVKSYNGSDYYIPGLNIGAETYKNYKNDTILGVNRVVIEGDPMIYVFDAANDAVIGTNNQISGLLYADYENETRSVDDTVIPLSNFRFIGEGANNTNTSLSALTKEEYLFGIVSPPEVKSDIFIDRGVTSVMDYHLKLSEIKNLGGLVSYGNGFYNITKQ